MAVKTTNKRGLKYKRAQWSVEKELTPRRDAEVFPARCISHINDFGHGVTALDIQWHLVGRPYNGALQTFRWSPWNKLKGGGWSRENWRCRHHTGLSETENRRVIFWTTTGALLYSSIWLPRIGRCLRLKGRKTLRGIHQSAIFTHLCQPNVRRWI